MKNDLPRGAMSALLFMLVVLAGIQPVTAAPYNIPLSSPASKVLYSATVCHFQPAPINGIPQWPVIRLTAHRKNAMATGLLAIDYGNFNGQWFEYRRYTTTRWVNGRANLSFNTLYYAANFYVNITFSGGSKGTYPLSNTGFSIPPC